jgi:uroporphyrinogen-III decarboxylase
MDGAILFSDILMLPHALRQKLAFVGEGPRTLPTWQGSTAAAFFHLSTAIA